MKNPCKRKLCSSASVHPCFSANFSTWKYRVLFCSMVSAWNLGCTFWLKERLPISSKLNLTRKKRKKNNNVQKAQQNLFIYTCTNNARPRSAKYQKTTCRYTFYNCFSTKKSMTKRAVWYYSNSKLPTFWHTERTRFTSKNGVQTNCDSRTV